MRRFFAFSGNDSGSTGVIFAVAALPALLMVTTALNASHANTARAELQSAVDEAVLAGASATSGQQAVAQQTFAKIATSSGFNVLSTNNFPYDTSTGKLSGKADISIKTLAFGASTITIGAAATATAKRGADDCVLALGKTGNTLYVGGSAVVNMPNCAMQVNSTSSGAASVDNGLTTQAIYDAGTTSGTPAAGSVYDGQPTLPNPYTVSIPAFSGCDFDAKNFSGGSINTGKAVTVVCNNLKLANSASVQLAPGTYIFDGAQKAYLQI
ncbi:MAG: Tad domain-containing protein [Hyphomicrobiales bacterium]|nr:Tad domain-containing protein [Hyphomicrobiales bacterium]